VAIASIVVNNGPEASKVRAAEVVRTLVSSRVLAQGKVRARRQVEVGSEITGRVTKVFVEIGDLVKVGDPLFALDDEQLGNTVRQLRVALKAADAMYRRAELMRDEAKRNLERDTRLNEKKVLAADALRISSSRVELAGADVSQSSAAVERARLDLLRAQDALSKAQVLAPIEGTVVAVNLEVGQIAAPVGGLSSSSMSGGMLGLGGGDPGATIVIADLSELLARLAVDELDVAQVKLGQPVEITAQGQRETSYAGVITRVGLMGRDVGGSVQFPVEASVQLGESSAPVGGSDSGPSEVPAVDASASPAMLRPGMSVSAQIEVKRLADALAIPVAAVLEGDGRDKPDRVWKIDDGISGDTVEEAEVKLGPTDDDIVAVLGGLEAGDKIVEGPFRTLRTLSEGDTVHIDEMVETRAAKRKDARKDKDKDKDEGDSQPSEGAAGGEREQGP
jgi:multidrug efflux pump subunit AcrA (membrane-fusion protein)